MGETQRNLETSPDMAEVKQNIGKVVAITVTAEQKRQELAETALLFDKIIFEKIITGMGMDPKITKELLISDRGLRIAFLKQISHVHPNLSPKERKYLYQLVHEINISIEEEQRTLEVFGKYNPDQYQQEVRDELKINHPKLANKIEIEEGVQRKPTIERTTENESREAQKWASNYQLNYRTGQTFDAQSISQMQVGKPIKMSEDTTIVLRKNGSCTVVTPYSKETIPPEKANIAIGFISVAKIFPGLDFMDGLHEALQSYSTNPLLSKMKDGCSKREECNLIKHYAELLGIAGFNENADTPDALVQSIKNCIPLGESFTGLARKK